MTDLDQLLTKKVADRYLKREVLGEGTYGVVFKAIDTKTGQTVAIKKIRLGKLKEGVNFTALREIKLWKEIKDPSIIELIDAFPHKGNLHLVFEFLETDLEAVMQDRNIVLSPTDIKSYLQMTLKGLAVCHKKWGLHRDMKPNNLLIGPRGQLKLADFGLARIFGSPDRRFTHQEYIDVDSPLENVDSPLANVDSPLENLGSPLANVDSLVDNSFRAKPNRNSNSNKIFTKNISMDLQDSPVIKPDREANKRFRSPRKVVESESSESEDDSPIKGWDEKSKSVKLLYRWKQLLSIYVVTKVQGQGAILVFLTGWDEISKLLHSVKTNWYDVQYLSCSFVTTSDGRFIRLGNRSN